MRSIKNKLIMLFGGMITIVCLGLCMISYISSAKALKRNVETTLPEIAVQTANYVNSDIQGIMAKLQATAERPDLNDPNISIYDKGSVLKFEAERNNALRMIYADAEKNTINQDSVFYSPTEDAGYFKAMSGVSNVSDPRISKASGNMVIVYSVPVKYNGEIVGVLSETRDANAFSEITDKVNVGETGKAYIVNSKGVVIAHHDRDLVTNMENVIEKAKEDA